MKPVRFHPQAEAELAAEARYYEVRSPGLGESFTTEARTLDMGRQRLADGCPAGR